MTRNINQEIDSDFLRMRLQNAWDYRKKQWILLVVVLCLTMLISCQLVIDKFEDVLVVQSLALGIDAFKEEIVELMKDILLQDGITIRGVYERSDAKELLKEGIERVKGFIGEPFDPHIDIVENGVKYHIDVAEGQKTGFFLDQKYNRLAIQKLCKDAKVLDVLLILVLLHSMLVLQELKVF